MNRLLTLLSLFIFSSSAWSISLDKNSPTVTTIISAGDDAKTIGISVLVILTVIAGYKLLRKSL